MGDVLVDTGVGTVLGDRYELTGRLGQGGTARVWTAADRLLGREVAVKLIDVRRLDDRARRRFSREARTTAVLNHPHIVTVHDLGVTDDDVPYLVMELVRGESLADVIGRGRMPFSDAVAIARQVSGALQAAHAAGVVHRDVKPGNILITPDGSVKVCDFGIASVVRDSETLTETGMAVGTALYMAPEQARAKDTVDHRADLYALGCVIYAMATGAPPFSGDSPVGVAWQHLHQQVTPLQARRPDTPAPLAELVSALLAKDPAARPASAAEVASRLESSIDGKPQPWRGRATVETPPPGEPFTTPLTAPVEPRRRVGPLAAIAALAIAAVLAVTVTIAALRERDSGQISTPSTPNSPVATAAGEPSRTDPGTAFAALERAVGAQAGAMSPEGQKEVRDKTREVGKELAKGDERKAAGKLQELSRKLTELRNENKIEAEAFDALQPPVKQLAAALPPPR